MQTTACEHCAAQLSKGLRDPAHAYLVVMETGKASNGCIKTAYKCSRCSWIMQHINDETLVRSHWTFIPTGLD